MSFTVDVKLDQDDELKGLMRTTFSDQFIAAGKVMEILDSCLEELRNLSKGKTKPTDTEMLDWLEAQNNKAQYTGKCVFRWSAVGHGWRLHESSRENASESVRSAIQKAMEKETQNEQ